jgi:hypothetical protein
MIKYTTINHEARVELGLSQNEYSIADSIYHLSNNPKAKSSGWCNAKKDTLAEFIGIHKRTVIRIINDLVEAGLLIRKGPKSTLLKTTSKWYEIVVEWEIYAKKGVTNLHTSVSASDKTPHHEVTNHHLRSDKTPHPSDNNNNYNDKIGASPFDALKNLEMELVEAITAEQLFLEQVCMLNKFEMKWVLSMAPVWATENATTIYHGIQHKKNSFSKFVKQAKANENPKNKTWQAAPTSPVMKGKLLLC